MISSIRIEVNSPDDLSVDDHERLVRRVLQSARLTRMPVGVKVTRWSTERQISSSSTKAGR